MGLLLTPLNKHVDEMNSRILQLHHGAEYVYHSADYFAEEAAELELTCQMFGIIVIIFFPTYFLHIEQYPSLKPHFFFTERNASLMSLQIDGQKCSNCPKQQKTWHAVPCILPSRGALEHPPAIRPSTTQAGAQGRCPNRVHQEPQPGAGHHEWHPWSHSELSKGDCMRHSTFWWFFPQINSHFFVGGIHRE